MSLSRQVLLILAILGLVLATSCPKPSQQLASDTSTTTATTTTTTETAPPATTDESPDPKMTKSRGAVVVVALEGTKAVPHPDTVRVPARAGKHGDQPVPSAINWFGPADKKLKIEMVETNCLRAQPVCNGDHCVGVTDVNIKAETTCKYKVWFDGVTQPYDPVVVVDDCCGNVMEP